MFIKQRELVFSLTPNLLNVKNTHISKFKARNNTHICLFYIYLHYKKSVMVKAKLESINNTEAVSLYSIHFETENLTEFARFLEKFKDNASLQRDFLRIVQAVQLIMSGGALERRFRMEGKMNDSVCALPVLTGKLRLYCLRLSDKVLVIGNGGIKDVKTYQESTELTGYVMDLQKFDAIIKDAKAEGLVSYEIMGLDNLTDKYFDL